MWGLKPRKPGGSPVINLRSETRRFPDKRCLVAATEFFLRDHTPSRTLWRFTRADGDSFYFAGIWRPPEDEWPEAFALLTTAANADVAAVHNRQLAVIPRGARLALLEGGVPQQELLRPLPPGTFRREPASRRLAPAAAFPS